MCDWLHQIDIAKYDFRSAPMTKDKEDTNVYETRAEGHMTRAVFELTDLADTPFLFIAAEVAGHFKLSDGDGQAALGQAGYQTIQRSHKGRKARYWAHPKHLQKTGCVFSLWTPNSDSFSNCTRHTWPFGGKTEETPIGCIPDVLNVVNSFGWIPLFCGWWN